MFEPWTEDESRALDEANRRLKRAQERIKVPTPRPRATPKQLASGRWSVAVVVNGERHRKSFNTYTQAVEWRDRHY